MQVSYTVDVKVCTSGSPDLSCKTVTVVAFAQLSFVLFTCVLQKKGSSQWRSTWSLEQLLPRFSLFPISCPEVTSLHTQ